MKKIVIAALLGATVLTGGAVAAVVQNDPQAQDTPKPRMMRDPMMMADANKDGVVTRDETIAAVTARFARLDADKDGKITREERQAAREGMGRGMGKRMGGGRGADANGDGILSLDEQTAQALKRFDFVDRNGDGKADQAERELVRDMMREMGAGKGRGHHRGKAPHHGGQTPPASPAPAASGS